MLHTVDTTLQCLSDVLGAEALHFSGCPKYYAEHIIYWCAVLAVKPRYLLEIGTYKGGTALIATKAMDFLDYGEIVTVDDGRYVPETTRAAVKHRVTFIVGRSPYCLQSAYSVHKQPWDMVLIDGSHDEASVSADLAAVYTDVRPGGTLLFHDSYMPTVKAAIDKHLEKANDTDCGELTPSWCGFRKLLKSNVTT